MLLTQIQSKIYFQATQAEIKQRQPSLAGLGDVVAQLTKLAEENSFSEPENNVKVVADNLTELNERLSTQKASVVVSTIYFHLYINAFYVVLIPSAQQSAHKFLTLLLVLSLGNCIFYALWCMFYFV